MRSTNSGKRSQARLSRPCRTAFSSYHGKVHNSDITINPRCAYREMLLDSASTGHANIGLESQTKRRHSPK